MAEKGNIDHPPPYPDVVNIPAQAPPPYPTTVQPGGVAQGPSGNPPQGYPPQGYPPQGYPPQGYPPQGNPPQGYPPQGYPPKGYPPQGYPPQGYPPQGYPPQGYPPQGYPPQGYPPQPPPQVTSTIQSNVTVVNTGGVVPVVVGIYPSDYCGLAWFACLCCCCPIGICAIVQSNNAREAINRGDLATANYHSQLARKYANGAIVAGILIIVLSVVMRIVLASASRY